MSLLCNISIYILMVLPIILLSRGYNMRPQRLLPLVAVIALSLIAQSTIITSLTGSGLFLNCLQQMFKVLAVPVMDAALIDFALNDPKARKSLQVMGGGDDASAAVAVAWTAVDVALYRWFNWYHVMGQPGFDEENLRSAVEAFVNIVSLLIAARLIEGRVQGNEHNSNKVNSTHNVSSGVWIWVAVVRVMGNGVAHFYGNNLIGSALNVVALLCIRCFLGSKTGAKI
ncbi:hypothetical protein, conserved [Trypanosoma brucei gambiense DAL972]|uniref:Uncharacterized protein n=1 Tax=Trypanosoma brucei gambiense (strain MHOM/CI/86/DAL972) TaxID=679716 RepID=C9ZTB3_TRYB9|nr:hypothetical protein, conserved [Trypanosoma brucei gambiense DAL972]CBH12648.1 hypothetical protein, conserved [Trypanosoma brucei gambiense DAL972]|eukprot:XP_011774928.1 hypothetical protein, conserved [Trypanosoma brucei gambiense DAL972]